MLDPVTVSQEMKSEKFKELGRTAQGALDDNSKEKVLGSLMV